MEVTWLSAKMGEDALWYKEDNQPQEELEYSMASIADVDPSIESAVPDELTETD